ncbi:MAG: DUF4870 domain-containing protein, partial [Planctomycetota bacterium]
MAQKLRPGGATPTMKAAVFIMTPTSAQSGRWIDDATPADERTYTTFIHLMGLLSFVVDFASGIVSLLGTVIMWRIKSGESEFLDDHGREAVNFQITMLIYAVGGAIAATIIGVIFSIVTLGVGVALMPLWYLALAGFLIVLRLVGCIRGAIAANRGEYYRYPMTIRILKHPDDADEAWERV